jgi:hypothetical protein
MNINIEVDTSDEVGKRIADICDEMVQFITDIRSNPDYADEYKADCLGSFHIMLSGVLAALMASSFDPEITSYIVNQTFNTIVGQIVKIYKDNGIELKPTSLSKLH